MMSRGMKGMMGGDRRPTAMRYARWLRVGSMSASSSVKSFRDLDGSFSHVSDSRETATLPKPITMANSAFRFL